MVKLGLAHLVAPFQLVAGNAVLAQLAILQRGKEPGIDATQRLKLLVRQGSGPGRCPHVHLRQVESAEVVQDRCCATLAIPAIERAEVGAILLAASAHVEHGEASLVQARRHHPLLVGGE